jgi:membrane protease subunit HflC
MNKTIAPLLIVLALALVAASQALFIVDQTQQAIVLQLGEPRGEPRGPGIHVKIPLIQDVRYFDRRIIAVDPGPEQMVISSASGLRAEPAQDADNKDNTAEDNTGEENTGATTTAAPSIENVSGEPIIVDAFARYKIVDPLQFMKSLRTIDFANSRLEDILQESTKAVLGHTSLQDLLSTQRTTVMGDIQKRVNRKIEQDQLGIEIVDVRIVRADLTADLRTSTVRRMISELQKRATETRAKGEERALEIRSTAEKERAVILAEAERDAQMTKGEGDKTAIKIYADAFNKDKEFYSFIRSMEAYKNTLSNPETRLILSPDSDFFRYFQESVPKE